MKCWVPVIRKKYMIMPRKKTQRYAIQDWNRKEGMNGLFENLLEKVSFEIYDRYCFSDR